MKATGNAGLDGFKEAVSQITVGPARPGPAAPRSPTYAA